MKQKYKAVYFADLPADESRQKSVTLAFGTDADGIFQRVKDLSSQEIRQLLGSESYQILADAAREEELPLNRYCLRQIKRSLSAVREARTQYVLPGIVGDETIFDPLSVTFKGGAQEPFARWYPYLQGYSTQYVERIIEKYAPQARTVLDPFAGTGTTVFAASRTGIRAYFCEVNPVLQFICMAKIKVRRLAGGQRLRLFERLMERREDLSRIKDNTPDSRLADAYAKCFGDSRFFDDDTFDSVLRLRTWIDTVSLEDPQLADLLAVAAISVMVPSSKMTRGGDLRYKTASEEKRPSLPLIDQLSEKIREIALDISSDVNGLKNEPVLVTENALSLAKIPHLDIDAVITSPPYVNGTNYFRNTKIELWFLRCLNTAYDLGRYRAEALTAGINDVTVRKTREPENPEVRDVVAKLRETAYDSRIPKMIGSYFAELTDAFVDIRTHLTNGAVVAVDIGDSSYGGVHIPVDRLLSSCLRPLGFEEREATDLRHRRSKSGVLLKQRLMIYSYSGHCSHSAVSGGPASWASDWKVFQCTMPHQQLPFRMRNWGHPLHSLCSYPGKMKPAIAHFLVSIFVPSNGTVLDPFAGVGTIPFEAGLQGRASYGFEISPAAFSIAAGKTQEHSPEKCLRVIGDLRDYIANNDPSDAEVADCASFGFNGRLADYFHSSTLREVLLARRFFSERPPATSEEFLVLASLLHILHGNRPYALSRRSHPITPYKPTGSAEYRSLVTHLEEKVARVMSQQLPPCFRPSHMLLQDATSWWPKQIDEIDAVITSPPFFDSTRFYLANWMRLWFCGWNQRDFDGKPLGFVEERQKKSFDVYVPVLRQARERLKTGGVFVFHLGKSYKCDMSRELLELGKRWFNSAEVFEENVSHCESHGIRDKGTTGVHQYLVLH